MHMLRIGQAILVSLMVSMLQTQSAVSWNFVEKDADGTKHINAPFVHIDVHPKGDGTKAVSVDAPFTHVRNPGSYGKVGVSAPFTSVHDMPDGSKQINAPFAQVHNAPDGSKQVSAPFTQVHKGPDGSTAVSAPFTKSTSANGTTRVNAPFTKVHKASNQPAQVKAPFTDLNHGKAKTSP
jgi:hypothetical protein